MTTKDVLLAAKVAAQRVMAAVRPPAAPALRIEELLRHETARGVVDQFHALWYSSEASAMVAWQGYPIGVSP